MDEIASLIATDHIQVEITIRLGQIRLSVAELGALRPDDVLPLDHDIGEGVDICTGCARNVWKCDPASYPPAPDGPDRGVS